MNVKYRKYWRKTSLKQKNIGNFFLRHVEDKKPKNFMEIGIFHGVTARNVCELLYLIHGKNFTFTGIDLFLNESEIMNDEFVPSNKFSNPLKTIYFKHLLGINPYSMSAVLKLLEKFKDNINIIKGDSNKVLKKINLDKIDYVFLDGGHKYETVINDLEQLTKVIYNNGTILCDDYNLSYAPGVKDAIDAFVTTKKFNLRVLCSRFAEITKLQ